MHGQKTLKEQCNKHALVSDPYKQVNQRNSNALQYNAQSSGSSNILPFLCPIHPFILTYGKK